MAAPLENVLVVEKMMDLETVDNPKGVVYIGPTNQSLFKYAASSASASNIIFNNICAPSLSTVMKRTLRIEMSVNVVATYDPAVGGGQFNAIGADGAPVAIITGTGGGGGLNDFISACLRACPLGSVISSADVRLNGGSTNCSLNQYNLIYPFITGDADKRRYAAEMPLQADNSAVYEPFSVNSPFLGLQANSNIPTRASYLAVKTGATATTNSYTISWVEELFISPFLTGHSMDDVGLANVNNLTIALRLDPLANMISSIDVGGVAYVVTLGAVPNLLVEFNSQNSILAARTPQTCVYNYDQIQSYTRSMGNVSGVAGAVAPGLQTGDALRLPCLPSKIYLFACPTVKGPTVPDTFLRITKVSINFNDKTNLLAGFDEASLYQMSQANAGGKSASFMNINQWKYGCGSIIVIDVEKNLSIAESAQSGSQNQFSTLQCSITFDNSNLKYASAAAVDYTLFQVVVSPGKAFVSPSQCEFTVLGPSPSEVLSLTASGDKVDENDLPEGNTPTGKGFMDVLSRGLSLVAKHVKPEHLMAAHGYLKNKFGGAVSGAGISGGGVHRRAHGGGISMG
jgi:hypothetical protein